MWHAIGLVEFVSIAQGIESADAMVKIANVILLMAKTFCPGKYLVLVGGDTSAVQQSIEAGVNIGAETVIDQLVISNIHPSIIPAIMGVNSIEQIKAIGVIEAFNVVSLIEAADVAVKAADVEPLCLHIAIGIGGKSYVVLTGEVDAVQAAVDAGSKAPLEKGFLTRKTVIPRPDSQLIGSFL